jgi:hypothetical protein
MLRELRLEICFYIDFVCTCLLHGWFLFFGEKKRPCPGYSVDIVLYLFSVQTIHEKDTEHCQHSAYR